MCKRKGTWVGSVLDGLFGGSEASEIMGQLYLEDDGGELMGGYIIPSCATIEEKTQMLCGPRNVIIIGRDKDGEITHDFVSWEEQVKKYGVDPRGWKA